MDISWNLAASPFASVLGTNHVPSSAELSQLKAELVKPLQELGRLESEIGRVKATLNGFLSEKKRVETYIEAHQSLMSPIRQLPSETLAEIFLRCLPSGRYAVRSLEYAPLLMTSVCRHWRTTAIQNPLLWNSLHIHFPPHLNGKVANQRIDGIALWLERSGTLPISLSLHGSTTDHLDFLPEFLNTTQARQSMVLLFQTVLRFSDRIHHLSLSLAREDFTTFDSFAPAVFQELSSLVLEDYQASPYYPVPWEENEGNPTYGPLLSRMPALQNLEINKSRDRNVAYHALPCHWESLTNISIRDHLTPVDLLDLLTVTPQLQSVKIGVMLSEPSFHPSRLPMVILNDLISLSLHFITNAPPSPPFGNMDQADPAIYDQMSSVFPRLNFPSLKSLSISWHNGRSISQISFSGLNLHSLESLALEMPMTPEALTECLLLVPGLISLDFVDMGSITHERFTSTLQNTHLTSLSPSTSDSSFLCPQLRHFRMIDSTSMSWPGRTSWTDTCLTAMIESRAKSNALISCDIFFHEMRSFPKADLDKLKNLKEDGLKLRLHQVRRPPPIRDDSAMAGLRPFTYPVNVSPPLRWPTSLADMDGSFDTDTVV
ncbi:hypothetical protein BDP27DRAFT_1310593 [Rhodocollybia butyracea]|uniref:F-box domain-containing protein n=1 Tax=Rhodocollybia butyracea TaxID=206335 RepID=A0A9P5QB29_9AGAR|nr:hypothetical protein BDP27DRAFT_1310593 [Rhodocollybia butyracea]